MKNSTKYIAAALIAAASTFATLTHSKAEAAPDFSECLGAIDRLKKPKHPFIHHYICSANSDKMTISYYLSTGYSENNPLLNSRLSDFIRASGKSEHVIIPTDNKNVFEIFQLDNERKDKIKDILFDSYLIILENHEIVWVRCNYANLSTCVFYQDIGDKIVHHKTKLKCRSFIQVKFNRPKNIGDIGFISKLNPSLSHTINTKYNEKITNLCREWNEK